MICNMNPLQAVIANPGELELQIWLLPFKSCYSHCFRLDQREMVKRWMACVMVSLHPLSELVTELTKVFLFAPFMRYIANST